MSSNAHTPVGLLLSGGLDSSILLGHLLRRGHEVQPFYVRCGLIWEHEELPAVQRYLAVLAAARLRPLVVLDMPLSDLYASHWSVTGRDVPDARSPDEAVYLPGRNLLLVVKAALWCQMHGIGQLALGLLGSNPFGDATDQFFHALETALACNPEGGVQLIRPFAGMDKRQVMELGRDLPLEFTFSCIDPQDERHCGQCNKCAERQAAFALTDQPDLTEYALPLSTRS